MTKEYEWHKFADHENDIEVSANGIAVIEIKNKKICITKFHEQWFGFTYKCPHAGGLLANGYIDLVGNIVCPVHRYKFSLKNGRNSSGEGFYMKTFPIEKRAEGLFVGIEPGGLFGIFS
jgi:3-phenylpropionate/trans-cinnamate dioxygenase ferredoxin subunit